jgi:hypothetical protein
MSQEITSVTYRRYRNRTIFCPGQFSRVKPLRTKNEERRSKNAGGLRETLCPEMAFALAGGRLFAG